MEGVFRHWKVMESPSTGQHYYIKGTTCRTVGSVFEQEKFPMFLSTKLSYSLKDPEQISKGNIYCLAAAANTSPILTPGAPLTTSQLQYSTTLTPGAVLGTAVKQYKKGIQKPQCSLLPLAPTF